MFKRLNKIENDIRKINLQLQQDKCVHVFEYKTWDDLLGSHYSKTCTKCKYKTLLPKKQYVNELIKIYQKELKELQVIKDRDKL